MVFTLIDFHPLWRSIILSAGRGPRRRRQDNVPKRRWTLETCGAFVFGLTIVGAVLGIAPAAGAGGENYLPLVLGNRWEYALPGGDTEIQVVDRTDVVRGREVFVIAHTVDGTPIQEDYWSAPDGDVLFHGYYRPIEDFGVLCDPPVKLVDAPLLSGSTWSTKSELFVLPDSLSVGFDSFAFAVVGIEKLEVPAGTFTTTAIEPLGSAEQGGGPIDFPTRWVTSGIGTIRLGGPAPHDLETYSVVLAVLPTSWGAIKWHTLQATGRPGR
jgi:hypothetical protein